jgi:hypothetical protein
VSQSLKLLFVLQKHSDVGQVRIKRVFAGSSSSALNRLRLDLVFWFAFLRLNDNSVIVSRRLKAWVVMFASCFAVVHKVRFYRRRTERGVSAWKS